MRIDSQAAFSLLKRRGRPSYTTLRRGKSSRRHFRGARLGLVGDQFAQNGISTTSTIPTARLPAPSSANSFAYPGFVETALVPVGSGIIPEKSPANSDARPVTSIQLPIITTGCARGATAVSWRRCPSRNRVKDFVYAVFLAAGSGF